MVYAFDRSRERKIHNGAPHMIMSEGEFVVGKVYQERHNSNETYQDSYGIMKAAPKNFTPFQFIKIEGAKIIGRNVKTGQPYEVHLSDKGFRPYSDGSWNNVNCIVEIGDLLDCIKEGWLEFDPNLTQKVA